MKKLKNNKKLIKNINSELKEKYQFLQLANPIRIIFVRFLDNILVNIIPLILTLTIKFFNKKKIIWIQISIIIITFFIFFIYFVIIPYFWDGKTICKFYFKIKLINNKVKLKLFVIFIRELFITFLPWFVILLTNLILNIFFKINLSYLFQTTNKNQISLIIIRTVITIYFLWYIGLIFGLILNPNHQILFDNYFNLFNVNEKIIKKK